MQAVRPHILQLDLAHLHFTIYVITTFRNEDGKISSTTLHASQDMRFVSWPFSLATQVQLKCFWSMLRLSTNSSLQHWVLTIQMATDYPCDLHPLYVEPFNCTSLSTRAKEPRVSWIATICIDQENVIERRTQVYPSMQAAGLNERAVSVRDSDVA